jgi:hypothetical protein
MELTGNEVDSASLETPGVEAILTIIEPGSAEIVAPQLARYRLNKQLFGNEEWGEPETQRKVQRYIEGMVYVDPLAPLPVDSTLAATAPALLTPDARPPTDRIGLAGERAASMLIGAYERVREKRLYRDAVATLHKVETLSGPVSLVKEERIDREPGLMIFRDGKASRLRP